MPTFSAAFTSVKLAAYFSRSEAGRNRDAAQIARDARAILDAALHARACLEDGECPSAYYAAAREVAKKYGARSGEWRRWRNGGRAGAAGCRARQCTVAVVTAALR
jgi:hypothetical protein